jgi:hypothetical protein
MTPAYAKATNGFCTQVGNDHFTWFGTTGSNSRRNFLDLLRAGHTYPNSSPLSAARPDRHDFCPSYRSTAELPDLA